MKYISRYSFLLDVQILLAFKFSLSKNSQMAVTVFAVAFATYLAYGIHPETVQLMSPK